MKSLTIRQRIQVSFLAILVLMTCVAVMNYRWFLFTEQEAERVSTDTLPALSASLRMRVVWARVDRLVQDLAESRSAEERDRLAEALATSRTRLTRLLADYEATVDSELDRINYQALVQVLEPFFPAVEAVLAKSEASDAMPGRPVADTAEGVRVTLLPLLEKVESILENMAETAQRDADDSARDIVSVVRSAELALIVGGILALLLSILSGYLLNRSITVPLDKLVKAVGAMREGDFSERVELSRKDEIGLLADGFNAMADELTTLIGQVQRSSIQVNTSITEIAATSKEQQATAGEIAATTAEVSDTAKDIAATSGDLVRNMAEVSSVAEQTAALAGGGQAGVERMERTMRDVMEAAGAINAKLTILSEKAGSINQVVTTITKVADQTNLLSLNAAIEAEKAGQYGRGFSVVATEIRRLADQTAASTQDIEQMVRDIQSAVAAGVMGMDKFSEEVRRGMVETQQVSSRLSQIIEQVQGLVPRFEAANEGMQAQAAGASQISDALVQLGEAAQQTVESLHQSAVAIDDLNQVSNGLRNSILRFKLRA